MHELPFSREELLDQTALLQALARQLAAHPADAEDAVQQTWVQALTAAPGSIRRWRPFLAVTLRNVVAFARRSERRRRLRDAHVAAVADRGGESAADLAARLELHRHLAALVLELVEPQRRLVLQHYFAGASIAVLAAQTGLTQAAVRGHLHRARCQLRTRLAAADGEAGRAFAALAAAAGMPLLVPSATVAMKTKLPAIAAVLAFVGFTCWLAIAPPSAPPPVPDGRATVAVADVAPTPTPTPAVARAEVEKPAELDPSRPWVVRGELMHGSVGPLPDTVFTASVYAGWRAEGEPLHRDELTSDADGAFAWSLPAPTTTVTIAFSSRHRRVFVLDSPRTFRVGDLAPGDLQVFAFLRDCRIAGRVTDEAGAPIPGAWVKGSEDTPQPCAADGSYEVMTYATYGDTSLSAGAPGHTLARQTAFVRGRGARFAMDFRLRPALRLTGRVVGPVGPVAEATVRTLDTWPVKVRTDADGGFVLEHLDPARGTHTVQVEHPQFVRLQRSIAQKDLAAPWVLQLQAGARVRGRVVGADGMPIEGGRILVGDFWGSGQPSAHTLADGSFEVVAVPPGPHVVNVSAHGHAPQQRAVLVSVAEPALEALEIRLEPGHWLAGRIVDAEGQGLHRIRITALVEPDRRRADEVYTARDGTFRLRDLPAGRITVDCFGMDVVRKEEANVAVDQGGVTVVLERAARMVGRVVDDATGVAVRRFSVRFVGSSGGYGVEWLRGVVFEDADGRWDSGSERFPPGAVVGVEVSADGYGPTVGDVEARVDADAPPSILRLRRAARIEGRVVERDTGRAIDGVRVTAFGDEHPLPTNEALDQVPLRCRTDRDGAFRIDGVPTGTLSLVLQHENWPLSFDGPFAVEAGGVIVRTVAVERGAVLRGIALDDRGHAVEGAKILREAEAVRGVRIPTATTTTDEAGRFTFAGLPTGRFRVHGQGTLPDGSTIAYAQRTVDATVGSEQSVVLDAVGTGAVEVVFASAGELPEQLSLIAMPADGAGPIVVSVPSTNVVVRGLPAGDLRLHVSSGMWRGAARGEAKVSVVAGATARVRIELPSH